MKGFEEIYQLINNISELPDETWKLLIKNAQKVTLKKDEYFVQYDEVAKEIGILTEGIVRSFYVTDEGKEYNKTLFAAPNIIGSYVSLITGEPNKLPQQALTDCCITKIAMADIETLSKTHLEVERLRRKIAEHFFVLKEKREVEMALLQAEERYLIFRKEFPTAEQQIPQFQIASYLGISATQLSRIRKKMAAS